MFETINPELKLILGFYLPNRFTINMGTHQLPIEKDENEKFNLFLHEYIHLIQNIFSVSGWYAFSYESSRYEAVAKLFLSRSEIAYPIKSYDSSWFIDNSYETLIKSIKYQKYLFEKDEISDHSKIEFVGPEFFQFTTPGVASSTSYARPKITSAFNIDGVLSQIKIGNFVILESMAYLIERYYNIHKDHSPDYPYKVLSKIFDASPLKGSLPIQIVITYLSLMHPFPDAKFKELFECVVNEKLYEKDLLEDVTRSLLEVHFPDTIDSIEKHFNGLAEHINEFAQVLSRNDMADKYVSWLRNVTTNVFANISKNPVHYINPILNRGGADEILGMLDLNYFLFDNSDGNLSFPKREIEGDASAVLFNRNFFHLLDFMLTAENRKCPMFQNCSLPEKDSDCEFTPFKHANRNVGEDICDYGQVAQLFGVHQFPTLNL